MIFIYGHFPLSPVQAPGLPACILNTACNILHPKERKKHTRLSSQLMCVWPAWFKDLPYCGYLASADGFGWGWACISGEQTKCQQVKGRRLQGWLNSTRKNPGQGDEIWEAALWTKHVKKLPTGKSSRRSIKRMKLMEMPVGEKWVLEKNGWTLQKAGKNIYLGDGIILISLNIWPT